MKQIAFPKRAKRVVIIDDCVVFTCLRMVKYYKFDFPFGAILVMAFSGSCAYDQLIHGRTTVERIPVFTHSLGLITSTLSFVLDPVKSAV